MRVISVVFVPLLCSVAASHGMGVDHEGFQRSNYYTNDQANNVGEIRNQAKPVAKQQGKKVEHFRNSHAKYHEPKKYSYHKEREAEAPTGVQSNEQPKMTGVRTNVEKRSQHNRDTRGKSSRSHYQIPSDRVHYLGQQRNERPVRKSFIDQGNSNWRWGFRRKQQKDHPLKDTSSYAGGNIYKQKDFINGHDAMMRNSHDEMESSARQSEPKMVGMKMQEPLYAPRQELYEDHRFKPGTPNLQRGTEYQIAPKGEQMHDMQRNVYSAPRYDSRESPYGNQPLETPNDNIRLPHKMEYNQDMNQVETKVLNKPIGTGMVQIPKNQRQQNEVRDYEGGRSEMIQNMPKAEEQRYEQYQKGNIRYDGLGGNMPPDNAPEVVEGPDVPRKSVARPDNPDGDDRKITSNRMKGPQAPVKYSPERGQVSSRAEEIRYIVLSPKEFNRETLRQTLNEPEKPQGIPYCTLEEYKLESASLKAKSYDAHERDMRYNGKGSINELISRLKRNNRKVRAFRRPILKQCVETGPEMPVHACTATPSTCERIIASVSQCQVSREPTQCWVEDLTRPSISAEDLGINYRLTPGRPYEHLRGRLPVISQFDYTAGTSCSTPCAEITTPCAEITTPCAEITTPCAESTTPCKDRLLHKRTPDDILLSDIMHKLRDTVGKPEPKNVLPNAAEDEKIIEKYLTALMEEQISRPKNVTFKSGPGWLEKLLKELAENQLRSKTKIKHTPRLEQLDYLHSKLTLG